MVCAGVPRDGTVPPPESVRPRHRTGPSLGRSRYRYRTRCARV